MKTNPIICTLITLPAVTSLLPADISLGSPRVGNIQTQGVFHSDILASNVVQAIFKGIRTVPVADLDNEGPRQVEVATFEVKKNLAHEKYDRLGDGAMTPGSLFRVSLAKDVPGQDFALGEEIHKLRQGDEALLKMDHIYLFRENGNESVRACTRFRKVDPDTRQQQDPVSRPPVPDTEDESEDGTFPGMSSASFVSISRECITTEKNGKKTTEITETRYERKPGQEKPTVRKFINNVEVDPETNEPLPIKQQPAANPQPSDRQVSDPAKPDAAPTPPQPQPRTPAPDAPSEGRVSPAPAPGTTAENGMTAPEFGF